jgi:hypothetical protein
VLPDRTSGGEKRLVDHINKFSKAPTVPASEIDFDPERADAMVIERRVSRKRGSWYQVPKDLPADDKEKTRDAEK